MNKKKSGLLLYFVFVLMTANGQMRYDFLIKKQIKEDTTQLVLNSINHSFKNLIFDLLKQEQQIRSIGIDSNEAAKQIDDLINLKINKKPVQKRNTRSNILQKIDSIDAVSYYELSNFVQSNCLIQINRKNFPDSTEAFKLAFSFFTLSIHLSDKYGLELMRWIETAINSNYCNKTDLVNYTITYLWRQTEFEREKDAYFIVPLPDLDTTPYAQSYLTAISLFTSDYAQKGSNKHFEYMIVPNWGTMATADFLKAAKNINGKLASMGTPPMLNPGRVAMYFKRMSESNKQWANYYKEQQCKYYFVCNDPGSFSSPPQTFLN